MAVVEKVRSLRAKAEPALTAPQHRAHSTVADDFGGSSALVASGGGGGGGGGGVSKTGANGRSSSHGGASSEKSSSKPTAPQDPDAVIRRVAKQGAFSEFAAAAAAVAQLNVGRARSPSEGMDDVFDQGNFSFVNRFASSKRRPNRGLWSQFGRPYVANGEPNLRLTDDAKRLRQNQRDKRAKKAVRHHNAPSRGERGDHRSGHHHTTTTADGASLADSDRRRVSPAIELLNKTRALKTKHVTLRRETDFSRYSFPKRVLQDADRRYQKSKNGARFGVLVEQEIDELGALFPLLEISDSVSLTIDASDEHAASSANDVTSIPNLKSKGKLRRVGAHKRNLMARLAAVEASASAMHTQSSIDDGTFQAGGFRKHRSPSGKRAHSRTNKGGEKKAPTATKSTEPPVLRWRKEFNAVRRGLQDDLEQQLASYKLDRVEAVQQPEVMRCVSKAVTDRVEQRKFRSASKSTTSVWAEAREMHKQTSGAESVAATPASDFSRSNTAAELDKAKRTSACNHAREFYRRLLVFVEQKWNEKLRAHTSGKTKCPEVEDILSLVLFVRHNLETVTVDLKTIFLDSILKSGQDVFDKPHLLEMLRFMRDYSHIRLDVIEATVVKAGWHLPPSAAQYLMSETNAIPGK